MAKKGKRPPCPSGTQWVNDAGGLPAWHTPTLATQDHAEEPHTAQTEMSQHCKCVLYGFLDLKVKHKHSGGW